MADAKKPSLEDILAACRKADGEGSGASGAASESPPAAESASAEAAPAAPAEKKAPAKSPGAMSVADMLAAARSEKSDAAPAAAAAQESEGEEPAKPAAPAKKPGAMSVQEMMAAARGEKSAAKPAAKAAPKPAAKAKPAAASAAKKESPKPSGPKDTASILAAARGVSKPGPVSKAEAAKSGQSVEKPAKAGKAAVVVPPMPQKPQYAVPRAASAPAATTDRRGFLSTAFDYVLGTPLAIGFTTLAVTNVLWLLGLARYMFPNILTEPPTKFKVGFPGEYAPGMVETKFKAEFGVWIVSYEYEGQPEIYALKSVCTHLGCTPNWLEAEQKFKCPCHGSGFYKDGINFEGPAPRPLERYAISISDDGQLEVDKSRTYQEEMGQWSDPTSYVSV